MHGRSIIAMAIATSVCAGVAEAHRPIFSDGSATSPDKAILIDDVDISYATYHEVTDGSAQLWLAFDATAGQPLYAQLGVPVIDRLRSFRPAVALVGPGLPAANLPFAIPEGMGAVVLAPSAGTEPEFFAEEFTGTDSWIYGQIRQNAPQDGRYYFVAYVPGGETGKLWVATGTEERFGLEDIATFGDTVARVRSFHEVGPRTSLPCCALPMAAFLPALFVARRLRRFHSIPR